MNQFLQTPISDVIYIISEDCHVSILLCKSKVGRELTLPIENRDVDFFVREDAEGKLNCCEDAGVAGDSGCSSNCF